MILFLRHRNTYDVRMFFLEKNAQGTWNQFWMTFGKLKKVFYTEFILSPRSINNKHYLRHIKRLSLWKTLKPIYMKGFHNKQCKCPSIKKENCMLALILFLAKALLGRFYLKKIEVRGKHNWRETLRLLYFHYCCWIVHVRSRASVVGLQRYRREM